MTTSQITINSSIIYEEREHIHQDLERRLSISGVIRRRNQTERRLRKQERAIWWGINDIEIAPKFQRKLAESGQEQPTSLARYGWDAIPKQMRTFGRDRCKCDYCVFRREGRERQRKETELMLRRVVAGKQTYGGRGYLDFDMETCDTLEEYPAFNQEEKIAGPAILDLMAIAKPSRLRKRPQGSRVPVMQEGLAALPLESVASDSGLEDEETWENIEDSDVDLSVVELEDEEEWESWSDAAL
ncbi:hypothetical protein FRC14_002105 [Serendipita sp. 396]|nr:hypothetical protein FRC14_002105 [Serendipita sp. 396]KAG8836155.1 hypothetical protein FRC18_011741 [Serendipita sp. 400]